MKKTVLLLISVVLTMAGTTAQNMFFPTKEGMTLEYANLNNKGKADNYTRMTIQTVEGSGDNLTVNYVMTFLDKNRKPASTLEVPYSVTIVNGVVELDMKNFATPGTESMITVEGGRLRIPSTLSPGLKLDDVNFTLTVNMGFKIRTDVALTEQECLAVEDITVPAGTFNCYKLTQTSTATVMRKTVINKIITWYTPQIGEVKVETYDAKNKLQTTKVLQAVEN